MSDLISARQSLFLDEARRRAQDHSDDLADNPHRRAVARAEINAKQVQLQLASANQVEKEVAECQQECRSEPVVAGSSRGRMRGAPARSLDTIIVSYKRPERPGSGTSRKCYPNANVLIACTSTALSSIAGIRSSSTRSSGNESCPDAGRCRIRSKCRYRPGASVVRNIDAGQPPALPSKPASEPRGVSLAGSTDSWLWPDSLRTISARSPTSSKRAICRSEPVGCAVILRA